MGATKPNSQNAILSNGMLLSSESKCKERQCRQECNRIPMVVDWYERDRVWGRKKPALATLFLVGTTLMQFMASFFLRSRVGGRPGGLGAAVRVSRHRRSRGPAFAAEYSGIAAAVAADSLDRKPAGFRPRHCEPRVRHSFGDVRAFSRGNSRGHLRARGAGPHPPRGGNHRRRRDGFGRAHHRVSQLRAHRSDHCDPRRDRAAGF